MTLHETEFYPVTPPVSLYLHIPWCERKCPYCDFNSHESASRLPVAAYISALKEDMRSEAQRLQGREIQTVFIGGGTPNLFPGEAMAEILRLLREHFTLANDIEVTMEANPGVSHTGGFALYRAAGVTRLSLGVQSFHPAQLQMLGRIHSSENAKAAIADIAAAGFSSWNLDLMHGLPGQSVQQAVNDLQLALSFKPPHISWYQLTIEPNTKFYSAPPELPHEDLIADMQEHGERLLLEEGYDHYEVSAFARPGQHCKHNLNYWNFGDFIALGAGAHGKLSFEKKIERYWKKRQPESYLNAAAGQFTAGVRELDQQERVFEFFLNALRLREGFNADLFTQHTGLAKPALERQVTALIKRDLLEQAGKNIRCTTTGWRFLNTILSELLPENGSAELPD